MVRKDTHLLKPGVVNEMNDVFFVLDLVWSSILRTRTLSFIIHSILQHLSWIRKNFHTAFHTSGLFYK